MPVPKNGTAMKWDATADASLFKCVLKVHDIKPRYPELEKEMRRLGYPCTAKAITHRISNIRNKSGPPAASPMKSKSAVAASPHDDDSDLDSADQKGKKTKTAGKGKVNAGPTKRKRGGATRVVEEDDDEEEGGEGGKEEGERKDGKKVKVEDLEEGEEEV